jgi:hypothetical protein
LGAVPTDPFSLSPCSLRRGTENKRLVVKDFFHQNIKTYLTLGDEVEQRRPQLATGLDQIVQTATSGMLEVRRARVEGSASFRARSTWAGPQHYGVCVYLRSRDVHFSLERSRHLPSSFGQASRHYGITNFSIRVNVKQGYSEMAI